MAKAKIFVLSIVVLLLGNSCSPVKVKSTEAAEGFHLSQYQTFGFYSVNTATGVATEAIPTAAVTILQKEVTEELTQRGLALQTENPDLLVNLGIVLEEELKTNEAYYQAHAPYYIGQMKYFWQGREMPLETYKEGTITIHLIDRAQNELVWRGVAESLVPRDREEVQARIETGVEKMFRQFPLKPR